MKKILLAIGFVGSVILTNAQSPTFQWAKSMGGNSSKATGTSIAFDSFGNICIAGFFFGTVDFDPGPGTNNFTSKGQGNDIFILKLDPSGNLIWVKTMGGISDDRALSIAVDASNNIYTTGLFSDTVDFDPGPGTFNLNFTPDGFDIFISKLDASGNFVWAKDIKGNGANTGNSIALDTAGGVYITGCFSGTADFDPGPGVYSITTAVQNQDIFILKLNTLGNFVWAKNMGGTVLYASSAGNSIAVDLSGNVYTTGYFQETVDFDPGPGTFNLTSSPSNNGIFILRLDASGNFGWAKNMGGQAHNDAGESIAIDASGYVYTIGEFYGSNDFDPGTGTFYLTSQGSMDVFISKLDADLGNFIWAKSMGGSGYDSGLSIKLDGAGNIYSSGSFVYTADFDPGPGIFNLVANSFNGAGDVFISKLNSSGNFIWAGSLVGGGVNPYSEGLSVAIDASDNIYTTGTFSDTIDFDPGVGTFNLIASVYSDLFVQKMSQSSTVGIKENVNLNNISIYPNPATNSLYIRGITDKTKLRLYDVVGKLVMEKEVENNATINTSHLSAGIYTLLTGSKLGEKVNKVVINR